MKDKGFFKQRNSIAAIEYERITNKLDKLSTMKPLDRELTDREYSKLMKIQKTCDGYGSQADHRMFKYLMNKIIRQREELMR